MSTDDLVGYILIGAALLPAFVFAMSRALRGKDPDTF